MSAATNHATPDVVSVDPRTGEAVEVVAAESTPTEVAARCAAAESAVSALAALGVAGRAALLRDMAAELEKDGGTILALADRESALGLPRLTGELARTCAQLRFLADVVTEGSHLGVVIDHPDPAAVPPRPDLRRMMVPRGPVAVFGASNFPLAFSVPGGDTASALAAGCPVVVKAHPAHPATSLATYGALRRAAVRAGVPDAMSLVHGQAAGVALVTDPYVTAVAFTGSVRGGRALSDLAAARPEPIPFFGELGSVNPLVVTPAGAAERGASIAEGLLGSFTLGMGQFCTKPGLAFVPAGEHGTALQKALAACAADAPAGTMLTRSILAAYAEGVRELAAQPGVQVLAGAEKTHDLDGRATPTVLSVPGAMFGEALTEECFGPVTVLVEYATEEELLALLGRLPGSLTVTLQTGEGEEELPRRVIDVVSRRTGRVVCNGYPTGVAVSWAMNHSGPYPAATDSAHTSVGACAVQRFLRPIAYQDTPQRLLPPELRDDNPLGVPRRVDGVLAAKRTGAADHSTEFGPDGFRQA
ncbi:MULTISPECIES: aldehyde dehydrogenase (NADP(+)) [unclassified Streptomyces]|uniref:aldehyde dehydrogenase (NADP(+)) n=1 Tax=unclassified Streptomyces TaxID=2593676 RepID=UPI0011E89FD8|nr:aldehyde dehydrogenase (NADP(+)) [Streptomyces sp. sk2.1]TXS79623.1 aldehyde dehydrogenase (NADP(+)) [Streptomyces sp. sk2.1]